MDGVCLEGCRPPQAALAQQLTLPPPPPALTPTPTPTHLHGVAGQPVLLLVFGKGQEERLGLLGGRLVDGLPEEVTRALHLFAAVARHKLWGVEWGGGVCDRRA